MKRVTVERRRLQVQTAVFTVEDDTDPGYAAISMYRRAAEDPYTGRTIWEYKVTAVEDVR